ncbi:helix-turn-helix domain-containing protein [Olivibacter jilunii]|uniref:AraC family transcriptional regulator n=1 Tax=Olivibacter jilunii TaxID=985016 RepID=UPI003F180D25
MEIVKTFGDKKIGVIKIHPTNRIDIPSMPCVRLKSCYMILHAEKDGYINIDFQTYKVQRDTFFFFSPGQHFTVGKDFSGRLIYFNPEFYCIAFHDKELACGGILFDNVFEVPSIECTGVERRAFLDVVGKLTQELSQNDFWTEEMARTYLKQLIIAASRSWMKLNPEPRFSISEEGLLSRRFSQLVEKHFTELHNASDYAALLYVSVKTLNRKIVERKGKSPNLIIKERIILQAKRLLVHTELSVKEIAYQLGYEDYSYFVRFFRIKSGVTPQEFRFNSSL